MTRWNACARLRPVSAEDHAHSERRPVFERAQRAEVVRDALGQHRHDPVGEIDRVAAFQRLAVERRPGPHIGGDVGDGDGDDKAAGIGRVGVGLGVDGVVVVLGVRRVDGDQRQLPPVLARRREAGGARGLGLFQRGGREHMRDMVRASAMRLTARSDLTEPSDSTTRALGGPKRPSRNGSIATKSPSFASPASPPEPRIPASRRALFDRERAARPVLRPAEDGEDARLQLVEDLDHPARIGGLLAGGLGIELDPHQHPRAQARRGRRARLSRLPRERRTRMRGGAVLVPFGGFGDQFAVAVVLGDVGDDDRGQAAPDGASCGRARSRPRSRGP